MMNEEFKDINQEMMSFLQRKTLEPTTQTNDVCEYCRNSGWEYDWDTNTARECRCGIRQRQIMESKLKFADIPQTYKDIRVDDIKLGKYAKQESKDSINSAKKVVEFWFEHLDEFSEQGKGIYFFSNTKGSGKTMMATAVANELILTHKKSVKFATSMQILNEIKSTWGKDSNISESSLIKDLIKVDYLVIDDFGTESVKDWMSEKFYHIINERYIEKKVTLYTSNYSIRNLPYEERITNRILERSMPVSFPEESVREMIARVENAKLISDMKRG